MTRFISRAKGAQEHARRAKLVIYRGIKRETNSVSFFFSTCPRLFHSFSFQPSSLIPSSRARARSPSRHRRSFKMVCIRQATMHDLLSMQRCNLLCLPENYQLKVKIVRVLTMFQAVVPRRRLLLSHPRPPLSLSTHKKKHSSTTTTTSSLGRSSSRSPRPPTATSLATSLPRSRTRRQRPPRPPARAPTERTPRAPAPRCTATSRRSPSRARTAASASRRA